MSELVSFAKWLFATRDYMLDYKSTCEYTTYDGQTKLSSEFNIGVLTDDEWDIVMALLDGLEGPVKYDYEKYVDSKTVDNNGYSQCLEYIYEYGYNVTLYRYH